MTVLNIKAFPKITQDSGNLYSFVAYQAVEYIQQPSVQVLFQYGSTQNTSATPYPIFVTFEAAEAFFRSTYAATLMANVNVVAGNLFTSYDVELVDPAVNSAIHEIENMIPVITTCSHIANGATNAANNNLTNYNLVSGVLGIAGGLNTANANQNAMADNLNDLAAKFNTLLADLQTNNILAA